MYKIIAKNDLNTDWFIYGEEANAFKTTLG